MYSQHIGMEFSIKICHVYNEKRKKTNNGRNRTTKSRQKKKNKPRTLGEKEIFEADTNIKAEMKEKIRKEYPLTNKKDSQNQDLQQKSLQRNKHLGCPPCKILGTILEMDEGRTSTNGPEDKKTNDDAQGVTSKR